jgi:FtsP/CotA-like multicopper oxidase with cupredoxin domain
MALRRPPPSAPRPLFAALVAALIAVAAGVARGPIAPVSVALVAASACSEGQAQRPCTAMERVSDGRTSSSTCPCPYIDGVTGGPGPVRRFTFVVQNTILPSLVPGLNKVHITVNGSIPGPAIVVNAGDWLEISVVNALPNEPTTLHWHGQLQVMTPFNDGVLAITQCPIQPGDSFVYSFRASNAGTFWCVARTAQTLCRNA